MTRAEQHLWLRAQDYLAAGQLSAARIAFESLLQRAPGHSAARMLLAGVFLADGRLQAASEHLLVAARTPPEDADTLCRLAQSLIRVGEIVAARDCLRQPLITASRSGQTLAIIAHIQQMLGEHEAALATMDRALACGFDNPEFRYFRSIQLQFNGRLDEARNGLDACLRLQPGHGRASLALARLRRAGSVHDTTEFILAQRRNAPPGSEDEAAFEFALYEKLDRAGQADAAFEALRRGNALMHARVSVTPGREALLCDALIETCSREFLADTAAPCKGQTPIFIIGMPRSGTSLLDRLLGGHSRVVSVGELGDFARQLRWVADCHGRTMLDEALISRMPGLDYKLVARRYLTQTQWRAGDKPFFIDKLPPNYLLAGPIQRALPQARILHMLRDPIATCFSNYRAFFGEAYPYSYDMTTLADHYRQYQRLMRHWHAAMPARILDVSYAALAADPEPVMREVLAFCGLSYEPGCSDTAENRAPVATLSSAQVRERVHTRAIAEWRRYERQLQPLIDALDREVDRSSSRQSG